MAGAWMPLEVVRDDDVAGASGGTLRTSSSWT